VTPEESRSRIGRAEGGQTPRKIRGIKLPFSRSALRSFSSLGLGIAVPRLVRIGLPLEMIFFQRKGRESKSSAAFNPIVNTFA